MIKVNVIDLKIKILSDFQAVRALIGESINYEGAKAFCESNKATLPKKKLEFQNGNKHDYWVDIENTSAVEDPELLETLKDVRNEAILFYL